MITLTQRTKKLCLIPDCYNEHAARGWCSKHYYRWKKYGSARSNPQQRSRYENPEDAFKSKIKSASNGCHVWTGSIRSDGYPQFTHKYKTYSAHRYAWERVNGPIPEGLVIDHMCHNPACVNVKHLRVVTTAENNQNLQYRKSSSRSGTRNVYWSPRNKKWEVRVQSYGKVYHGGHFDSIEEAEKSAIELRNKHHIGNPLRTNPTVG